MHDHGGLATKVDQTIVDVKVFESIGVLDLDPLSATRIQAHNGCVSETWIRG